MSADARELVDRLERAFGRAVATPEWTSNGAGGLERAKFRVWRFPCPVCLAHLTDAERIWRPLSVGSDGTLRCNANDCSPEAIAGTVREFLEVVDGLGYLLPVAP